MVRAAIAFLLLALLPSAAFAEKRIALLIGNKDYKAGVGALVNPVNDVRVVGAALKVVGFEVLQPIHNARRSDMLLAIHAFAAKLNAAGADAIGFLYFSGHGIASAGENYLLPIDIDQPSTELLSVEGVKHSEILTILRSRASNAAHYLVLDACRNTLQATRGGKGFVPLGQQSGVLVAFAAEPGKTASDVGQGSGPYAAALAAELVKPGQNDLLMFHNVRVAVMDKTKGDQVPWTEDGIQRRHRIIFGGERIPVPIPAPPRSEAAQTWIAVKDTRDPSILEAYIKQFSDTVYAAMARARVEELRKQQVPVATPPTTPLAPAPTKPTQNERLRLASAPNDEERATFVRRIQQILKRSQCYDGALNGRSSDTQEALNEFVEVASRRSGPGPNRIELAKASVGDFETWLKEADGTKDALCVTKPEKTTSGRDKESIKANVRSAGGGYPSDPDARVPCANVPHHRYCLNSKGEVCFKSAGGVGRCY